MCATMHKTHIQPFKMGKGSLLMSPMTHWPDGLGERVWGLYTDKRSG